MSSEVPLVTQFVVGRLVCWLTSSLVVCGGLLVVAEKSRLMGLSVYHGNSPDFTFRARSKICSPTSQRVFFLHTIQIHETRGFGMALVTISILNSQIIEAVADLDRYHFRSHPCWNFTHRSS
jgi:hypothetical protein